MGMFLGLPALSLSLSAGTTTMGRPRDLRRRYGLSVMEHREILESQNHCCAICGKNGPLVVDHDHADSVVRGLLCNQCNLMLGHAADNPATLLAGVKYLEDYVMSKWSTDELAALRATSTFHEWGTLTGYSKSYDAWETKRRRVDLSPDTVPLVAAPVENPREVHVVVTLRIEDTRG